MKKTLLLITTLLATLAAHASIITGPILDPQTGTGATTTITLQLRTPVVVNVSNVFFTKAFTIAVTSGAFTTAQLPAGNWNVQIGPRNDLLSFGLPNDTNTYTLGQLLSASQTFQFISSPVYLLKSGDVALGNLGFSGSTNAGLILNALTTTQRTNLTGTNGLNVSGMIRAGTGAAGGGSSGGRQVTTAAGFISSGDFDPSATGVFPTDSQNMHATNYTANVRNHFATGPISFDGGANGSGVNYESTSPGGIACITFGVAGAITGMFTSANQAWWAYPSMDIGADTSDGTKDGFCELKVHGSFGTDVKSKAISYTTDAGDSTILVTATGQTITLPDATAHCTGRIYTIKLIVTGSGTVATTSSQNIDAATTYSLGSLNKYVTVQSDGTKWRVIANN